MGLKQGLSQPKFGHVSSLFVVSYLKVILREHWNQEPLGEPTSEPTFEKPKYQPSGVPSLEPTSGNQMSEPIGEPNSEPKFTLLVEPEPRG